MSSPETGLIYLSDMEYAILGGVSICMANIKHLAVFDVYLCDNKLIFHCVDEVPPFLLLRR